VPDSTTTTTPATDTAAAATTTRIEATLRAELEGAQARITALERSEQDFRRLLDDSSDPIFAFDRDGRYRYVNDAFARGVGKPRAQIVGFRIWDVFEKTEADHRWRTLSLVLETGQPLVFEVRVPRTDGDRFYLTTVQPVLDDAGATIGAMCSSKEITDRKRMEGELEKKVSELEAALAHVKRLQGILPICSHCHRIRNDRETWERVEKYISEHSDVRFSHGLCPDCATTYYGQP
jgi:PAS domain S-box-containing protein